MKNNRRKSVKGLNEVRCEVYEGKIKERGKMKEEKG